MAGKTAKKRPWRIGFLVLLLASGVVVALMWLLREQPRSYAVKGIDVSRYQGNINWKKVKATGISFAFIKATEGAKLVDSKFAKNWKNARKRGVIRGAYHFYRPSAHSSEQAENFLENLDLQPGDLPPVLDLEVTDGRPPKIIRKGVQNWMNIVEERTGVRPILYTMASYANSYLPRKMSRYPLWLVSLRRRAPVSPRGWKRWEFWQYSHHGHVKGIQGEVDLNYYRASLESLKELCVKKK